MGRLSDYLWYGEGNDEGSWLFYDGDSAAWSDNFAGWIISSDLGFRIVIDGVAGASSFYSFNGTRYWGGGPYLWYDSSGGQWVISDTLGACIAEQWDDSDADPANHQYIGNEWYSCSTVTGLFEARGSLRGTTEGAFEGTPTKVTWELEGYRRLGDDEFNTNSDAPAGRYTHFTRTATVNDDGTVTTTLTETEEYKWVGIPQFTDQNDDTYTRSMTPVDGHYTYGDIHHDGTGWVIGTRDSNSGWYEGSQPDIYNSVTFYRKKTENGSYPGPSDLNVSFNKGVIGKNTTTVYLAEVGLWL